MWIFAAFHVDVLLIHAGNWLILFLLTGQRMKVGLARGDVHAGVPVHIKTNRTFTQKSTGNQHKINRNSA